jgi:putative transcriptional regulator
MNPTPVKHPPTQAIALFLIGAILLLVPMAISLAGYGGLILISRTDDPDSPFYQSLILVDHHDADGAVGIIINKPVTPEQKAELPPFLRDAGIPVGYGGPIGFPDRIVVLEEKQSKKSANKVWFDISDWDAIVDKKHGLMDRIKQDAKQGGQHYRVYAGLAAWAPFQIETETGINNMWYTTAPSHDLVFQKGSGTTWDALFKQEEDKKKAATEDKT